jgi:DNA adenine methylase
MSIVKSPLRYPGGKAKLFPFVAGLISNHQLYSCVYREPYAGGGGLALNLLFGGFCKSIALNDVDPAIYSFWWSVVHRTEEFCRRVNHIEFSMDEWHRQKDVWSHPHLSSELDLGFATYYLNRTNRSGIIEGAGPIGGYNQKGTYKMDARFSIHDQLTIIGQIGRARDFISVSNLDAAAFIRSGPSSPAVEEFTYLDPPYYVKGQRLYRNWYNHDDHVSIADLIREHPGFWMVSYDDVPQIRDIYAWAEPITISLQYSAGPITIGKEVIYLSDRFNQNIASAA